MFPRFSMRPCAGLDSRVPFPRERRARGRRPLAIICNAVLGWGAIPVSAQLPGQIPPDASRPHPGAASQPDRALPPLPPPAGAAAYQTGVWIDWNAPAVVLDGRVAQITAPLEFLACFPGKEHESLVVIGARPTHVFQALGLIGLTHGAPGGFDQAGRRFQPPTGDLVDVSVEWDTDGRRLSNSIWDWTRLRTTGRTPRPRPFVFGGSRPLGDGRLAADLSGAGLAVVDMPDALLGLTRSFGSQDADLWLHVDRSRVPRPGTPVRLTLKEAIARPIAARMDFRGSLYLNGELSDAAEVADAALTTRRLDPAALLTISVEVGLAADLRRLRRQLVETGLPDTGFHVIEEPAARSPATRPAR